MDDNTVILGKAGEGKVEPCISTMIKKIGTEKDNPLTNPLYIEIPDTFLDREYVVRKKAEQFTANVLAMEEFRNDDEYFKDTYERYLFSVAYVCMLDNALNRQQTSILEVLTCVDNKDELNRHLESVEKKLGIIRFDREHRDKLKLCINIRQATSYTDFADSYYVINRWEIRDYNKHMWACAVKAADILMDIEEILDEGYEYTMQTTRGLRCALHKRSL